LVKFLINIDPDDNLTIDDLDNSILRIPSVNSDTPLFLLLNQFINGRTHMASVVDSKDNLTVIGIVTLEDVIEALLDTEIYDETDLKKNTISKPQEIVSNIRSSGKAIDKNSLIIANSLSRSIRNNHFDLDSSELQDINIK